MTNKELQELLAQYPDEMEVSIMRDATEDFDGGVASFVVEDVFYDEEVKSLIIDA